MARASRTCRGACRERYPRHRLQRKPLVSDPSMHHGTCVTHVPWCMSGTLIRGGGENVPGIPGACATCNFTYLGGDPWHSPDLIDDHAFKVDAWKSWQMTPSLCPSMILVNNHNLLDSLVDLFQSLSTFTKYPWLMLCVIHQQWWCYRRYIQ